MRVILQVTSGPSQGRKIPLQSGERARFGRSDIADVCFPDDLQMSDVHFELECYADQCLVRDITGSGGTLLNAQPISEAVLGHGDLILAGQTQLETTVQGGPTSRGLTDSEPESEPVAPKPSATEICQLTDLEEEALELFRPKYSPEEFVSVLTENNLFADAARVLSLYLTKRQAIFWAYQSANEVFPRDLSQQESAALDAVMTWLKDSSEANRRSTMEIAEALEFGNAAACVAASAFWSEGSLAPADLAEVPPEPQLTGKVVAAALTMTATEGDPKSIPDRYRQILKIGQDVLNGVIQPPEQKSE